MRAGERFIPRLLAVAAMLPLLGATPATSRAPSCASESGRCSCIRLVPIADAVRQAGVALVGVAEPGVRVRLDNGDTAMHHRVRVERAWRWTGRGPNPPRVLTLRAARYHVCGSHLVPGARTLFLGDRLDDSTFALNDACTRGGPVDTTASTAAAMRLEYGPKAPRRWLRERTQVLREVEREHGLGREPAAR